MSEFPSFKWPSNIPLYVSHILFFHSSVDRCLVASTFWPLWIMLQWTWCTNICLSPYFQSFGYMPTSRIAGSYGNSMFNFLRNFQTVSCINCIILFPPAVAWGFSLGFLFFCFGCLCFWYQIQKNHCQDGCQGWNFKFDEDQFIYFFLLSSVLLMSYLRNCCQIRGHEDL